MARRGKISLTEVSLTCADLLQNIRVTNSDLLLYGFDLIQEESNPAAKKSG